MSQAPIVGAQDPDRKNSPIADESDEDFDATWLASEEGPVCYFNDVLFADGSIVKSDDAFLRCQRGVWVPIASSDPENP